VSHRGVFSCTQEADKCLRRAEQLLPSHYEICRLIVITLVCRFMLDTRKPLLIPRQESNWDKAAVKVRESAFQRYYPEYDTDIFLPPSLPENGCRLVDAYAFGLKLYSNNMWMQSEAVARKLEQVPSPLLAAHFIGRQLRNSPSARRTWSADSVSPRFSIQNELDARSLIGLYVKSAAPSSAELSNPMASTVVPAEREDCKYQPFSLGWVLVL
jgi:hypothetical protein